MSILNQRRHKEEDTEGVCSSTERHVTLCDLMFIAERKRLRMFALRLRHVTLCDLMFYYREEETKDFRSNAETCNLPSNVLLQKGRD